MNRSLGISFHAWRGLGPDREPDLFVWRWRVGFVTVELCRVCMLTAYQDAKAEAERLRTTINAALEANEQFAAPPRTQHGAS